MSPPPINFRLQMLRMKCNIITLPTNLIFDKTWLNNKTPTYHIQKEDFLIQYSNKTPSSIHFIQKGSLVGNDMFEIIATFKQRCIDFCTQQLHPKGYHCDLDFEITSTFCLTTEISSNAKLFILPDYKIKKIHLPVMETIISYPIEGQFTFEQDENFDHFLKCANFYVYLMENKKNLDSLPKIGQKLAQKLRKQNINTLEDFARTSLLELKEILPYSLNRIDELQRYCLKISNYQFTFENFKLSPRRYWVDKLILHSLKYIPKKYLKNYNLKRQ